MSRLFNRLTIASLGAAGAICLVAGSVSAMLPEKRAREACDCALPAGDELIVQHNAPPGVEWCGTQIVYESRRKEQEPPITVNCPLDGMPDDPTVRDAAIPTSETPVKTYRLSIHVFRENSGANPTASEADVANMVSVMNQNYAPHRIQFVYQWRFVNNTKYRYLDLSEDWNMKRAYADSWSTKLNIYIVSQSQGYSYGTFPWDSTALTVAGGIVLDQSTVTSISVPSHEVGHCLGLWHTFHGVSEVTECSECYEPVGRDATTGDNTGDRCSDTNPTPRNFTCNNPAGIDPCSGNPWSNTPLDNFMGYSSCGPLSFTAQQSGRMHAWTNAVLMGWLVLPEPPAIPGTPTVTKLGGGQVRISWSDQSPDETGFQVQRETKSGSSWTATTMVAAVGANTTSTLDSPGTGTFRYRVRSFNDAGSSNWTSWTQVKN